MFKIQIDKFNSESTKYMNADFITCNYNALNLHNMV